MRHNILWSRYYRYIVKYRTYLVTRSIVVFFALLLFVIIKREKRATAQFSGTNLLIPLDHQCTTCFSHFSFITWMNSYIFYCCFASIVYFKCIKNVSFVGFYWLCMPTRYYDDNGFCQHAKKWQLMSLTFLRSYNHDLALLSPATFFLLCMPMSATVRAPPYKNMLIICMWWCYSLALSHLSFVTDINHLRNDLSFLFR